jgi:hypothetical protein
MACQSGIWEVKKEGMTRLIDAKNRRSVSVAGKSRVCFGHTVGDRFKRGNYL